MVEFSFYVPGKPMGEPRKRVATRDANGMPLKFPRVYGTKEAGNYRALVQSIAGQAMARSGASTTSDAVAVEITAWRECPKSQHRKTRPREERLCTSKPDADNVAKIICDALNGVAWCDDSQVADLIVRKRIAAQGEPPRVTVHVKGLAE